MSVQKMFCDECIKGLVSSSTIPPPLPKKKIYFRKELSPITLLYVITFDR